MATSRRYPIALGLLLGGIACQALAEPPAVSNDNGLMTFKNVRVVNTPPAAAQQPAADAPSVRVFLDNDGELATPTAEQARQLSNASAARTRALTNKGATTASSDESDQLIYGPNNTLGLMLNDNDMVSQKVHLDAEGNLIQECVTGEDTAAHAAHAKQESNNAR